MAIKTHIPAIPAVGEAGESFYSRINFPLLELTNIRTFRLTIRYIQAYKAWQFDSANLFYKLEVPLVPLVLHSRRTKHP